MNNASKKIGICLMCQRQEIPLTFHHLIPKTLHSKKWYKKNYSQIDLDKGIDICQDCHEAIHDFISEKDLGRDYNSLSLLLTHDKIINFVSWVKKQKKARISSVQAKSKRR